MNRPGCILTAGSAGFIGRHVVEAAREAWSDASLFGLGRASGCDPRLDAYLCVDVRAENAEKVGGYVEDNEPDAVINCLGAVTSDYEAAVRGNLDTTQVLIQAVSGPSPGIGLVHLGPAAEYSPLEPPAKTDEATPPDPVSAYGKSKLRATRIVREATERGGISGLILRASNSIGPRMDPATLPGRGYEFLARSREDVLTLGSLASYRDFVDVRDVARAAVLAVSGLPTMRGKVFNVGSAVARTARELVRGMSRGSERDVALRENAEGSSRSGAVGWQEMDVAKAPEVLGWVPRIPLSQTLRYAVSTKTVCSDRGVPKP